MNAEDRELYRLKADILRAVAHPIRMAIVDCLSQGEMCVCDITVAVGARRSNVSRHLAVMLRSGVVRSHKDGLKVMYSLRTPCVLGFLSCVTDVIREQVHQRNEVLDRL